MAYLKTVFEEGQVVCQRELIATLEGAQEYAQLLSACAGLKQA